MVLLEKRCCLFAQSVFAVRGLQNGIGQRRKTMLRKDGVGDAFVKHLAACRAGRSDKRNVVFLKQLLKLAILAKRAVYCRKNKIDLLECGNELIGVHRVGCRGKFEIKIGRRIRIDLRLRQTVKVFLHIAVKGHDFPAKRAKVIQQGSP